MADKAISELVAAEQITATDRLVLEQNGTAKQLPGQVLLNWLTAAADGHGGIASIEKLRTSGLADTYRITLADTTTFDFVVTNGKGISSIAKKSTSGLVDAYAITYTDGTTGSFTVTNGAKGDKGDAAYIWVKYASQEPTATSSSFGDVPDEWMGIYVGTSTTAPTSYSSYKWYQIKGEQGSTGAPASLVNSSITYQVGDSGTVIPSGNWSASIPAVTPGRYLWTRQVLQFNTGNPITSYSVSRFGIDGSGAVSSVAGIAPDANGNVPLTAANVKALALSGGAMEGPIDMSGQKLTGLNAPTATDEAATKGYVDTNKVDKSSVVNNFSTTKEGYVADARTVKALHDTKLSKTLLWENAAPESSFAEQTISINLSDYDYCEIYFSDSARESAKYVAKAEPIVGDILQYRVLVQDAYDGSKISRRDVTASASGIQVGAGTAITGTSAAVDDSVIIPVRIYGVKGVS